MPDVKVWHLFKINIMRRYVLILAFKMIAVIFIIAFIFGTITTWSCYSGYVCLYAIMLFMILFFITLLYNQK